MNTKLSFSYIALFLGVVFQSCVSYHKTVYFQNAPDTINTSVHKPNAYKIQAGDVLKINIATPDSKSSDMYNMNGGTSTATNAASIYVNNYSVTDSGYVYLPLIGSVLVKNQTVEQVDSTITTKAAEYFNYSTVDVKLVNFHFVALGEFKQPGYTYIYNDKCTIFEAIALAGDATDFANKKKVILIRTYPNKTEKVFKLDLTDFSVYTSDAYYIQPNDKIYITPQKAKVDAKNVQYITMAFAGISTLLLVINYVK